MPKIVFIEFDGTRKEVVVKSGTSVMEAAVDNWVDGIVGECGGCCSCGTCHVYVAPEWIERTGFAEPAESDMLYSVEDFQPGSRLACQISMSDELDGLVVSMPEYQL